MIKRFVIAFLTVTLCLLCLISCKGGDTDTEDTAVTDETVADVQDLAETEDSAEDSNDDSDVKNSYTYENVGAGGSIEYQ